MTQYILKHCMSQHAVEVNLDRTARTLYDTARSIFEAAQNSQNIVWHITQ